MYTKNHRTPLLNVSPYKAKLGFYLKSGGAVLHPSMNYKFSLKWLFQLAKINFSLWGFRCHRSVWTELVRSLHSLAIQCTWPFTECPHALAPTCNGRFLCQCMSDRDVVYIFVPGRSHGRQRIQQAFDITMEVIATPFNTEVAKVQPSTKQKRVWLQSPSSKWLTLRWQLSWRMLACKLFGFLEMSAVQLWASMLSVVVTQAACSQLKLKSATCSKSLINVHGNVDGYRQKPLTPPPSCPLFTYVRAYFANTLTLCF